jgi:predicted PurR-regulated permease PerM
MKNNYTTALVLLFVLSVINMTGIIMVGVDINHKTSELFRIMDMMDMKFSRIEKLMNDTSKSTQEAQASSEERINTLNENLHSLHQDILTTLEPENFKMMVYDGCKPAKSFKK